MRPKERELRVYNMAMAHHRTEAKKKPLKWQKAYVKLKLLFMEITTSHDINDVN